MGFFYAHKDSRSLTYVNLYGCLSHIISMLRHRLLMIVSRHGKWQPFFCLNAKQSLV
nr:MAG TPA: hypothetical protein [Caudoviricetes sp.]